MNTKSTAAAAVTGARHLRTARNGQDAAVAWADDTTAIAIVCDGCSSGASSEVGARLGAQLALAILRRELAHTRAADVWPTFRAALGDELGRLASRLPGPLSQAVHDHFLFTLVAGVRRGDEVAVWALGDGGYAFGPHAAITRELGPFPDNQPPYLGYDLLGAPAPAHLEVTDADCGTLAVATDGVVEVGLAQIVTPALLEHPDAARRRLAVLARATERIDWDARRVVREPAPLQDDGAIAIARWLP